MCLIYGEVDKPLIFRFLYGLFVFLYKSSSIFIFGNRFSPILLLFYRRFHVFLTIAICIYLCFAEKVVFRFLAFRFISHTTRISNKTSFLCKRLVVKKNLRNNLSRFTNLKCFFTGRSKLEDLTSKLSQILAKICCLKLDLNWSQSAK